MHDILKKDVSGSAGFILILSKQIWKEKKKPVNLESDNVLGVQRKVSSRWWGKVKSSQAVGEDGVLCSREEEPFQLISHDRGVGLYVPPPPPACDLMERESAAALTQKPRRVESWKVGQRLLGRKWRETDARERWRQGSRWMK